MHGGQRVGFPRQAVLPVRGPVVKSCGVGELIAGLRGAEGAECVGEIGLIVGHQGQQVVDQGLVPVLGRLQADLAPEPGQPGGVDPLWHGVHDGRGLFDGGVAVGGELDQGGGELCHIPHGDPRLVGVGVTAHVVNRTEHRVGVVLVEESAGPVVDGLPGDGAVVGVHHTVNEAEGHPVSYQLGLGIAHGGEQAHDAGGIGIVPVARVVDQALQVLDLLPGGEDLKRAHAQVAGGHAGQHGAGQGGFPLHPFAGLGGGQGAGGGHP